MTTGHRAITSGVGAVKTKHS